jgi:phosphoribosylglycinamide formyltransferase-1
MMKMGWFTTGRDEEAFILLKNACEAIGKKSIDGEISVLFMNREKGESPASDKIIAFAEAQNIPVEALSSKKFLRERGLSLNEGRTLFDKEVKLKIARYDFDFVFLAGYMLILSREILGSYTFVNIHPSLPGAYKGKWEDVIRNTIEDGRQDFGAMVHMVSEILDEGPPISYVKFVLEGLEIETLYQNAYRGDSTSKERLFRIMREEEFAIEIPLIIKTLSMISQGTIQIVGKKVYFGGSEIKNGVDITKEVTK